ncbi:hypothetical protein ACPOL_0954 [Acidisarcina polymorpha]|uniref:HTH araC/xylS-type domain-containing protein n=1 Tax=Acidisarcina polymorpha TaxID=2211140 RepID=A0A2Z5FUW9_9BACT|nr:hypothetical protein ACPOL_0954 [Acidisarcina polymorpha]
MAADVRDVDEIGCSPKLYARIARFQGALDTKRLFPERTWLNIAHQFGFADQMHMVRDFHSLAGKPPSQTVAESNDMHPWSLAEFTDLPSATPTGIRGGTISLRL